MVYSIDITKKKGDKKMTNEELTTKFKNARTTYLFARGASRAERNLTAMQNYQKELLKRGVPIPLDSETGTAGGVGSV